MSVFVLKRTPRARGLLVAGPRTYAALVATALVFLLPFYYLVVAASRPMAEMAQSPPPLTPGPLLFSNVAKALDQQNIGLALVNSLVVAGVITLSTVLLCTLAGYAFAKLRFRGRGPLFALAVGTMMIPPSLGVVPLYSLMVALGLAGSLASVVLPSLVAAFGVFFMRQYLSSAVPDELVEAGFVDGAGSFRIFWSIIVPAARPAMTVLAMLTFLTAWNDFFWPIIALSSQNPTIQVSLQSLATGYAPEQSIIMAGTLYGTVPVLIVFALLGKHIVGGIMQGAVKG